MNIIYNVIRVGVDLFFPIITFPVVSKALGPEFLGKVNFSISLTSYFILMSSIGIPTYGVIVCSKHKKNKKILQKYICELFYINLIFTLISYITLFISLLFIPSLQEYRNLLLINSLSILFTTLGMEWLYSAQEEFRYITIKSIVFKLISLLMILALVHGPNDYFVYLCITVLATAGANICNFIHAIPQLHFYKLSELNIKKHIVPIFTFFTASLASTINSNTDIVMLGILSGNYSVGIYTFSVKIKNLLTAIISAGLTVCIPRFSTLVGEGHIKDYRNQFHKIVLYTMTGSLAISGYIILFVDEIVLLLGGEMYSIARSTIIILTLCVVVLGMTWSLGVGCLQVVGREKEYTKVILFTCFLNIALNLLFIPSFSYIGASLATLITEVCNMSLFYYYSKDLLNGCIKSIHIHKIIIVTLIDYVICKWIKDIFYFKHVEVILLLGALCFFTIYFILLFFLHLGFRNTIKQIYHKGHTWNK